MSANHCAWYLCCCCLLQDKALSVVGKKGSTLEAGQSLNDEVNRLFSTL